MAKDSLRQLAPAECWGIAGVSADAFFRDLAELVPEATTLYLEGAPYPDVAALLIAHVESTEYDAPLGTLLPRSQRYRCKASTDLFHGLARLAQRHAEPEICDHLHLYRREEPLIHWFDAFDDPLLVSKALPRARIENVCLSWGVTMSEAAV